MAGIVTSGLTGLEAFQQMLNVVGNNLANSNTTGFKAQNVEFSDLLYQTLRPASGSTQALGGINPAQIGSGVQVSSVTANLQQGTLNATGSSLDLALQGNGYFVVNNGVQNLYTRAGSFSVDADNYLVDPATGNRVQRIGTTGEGSATSPAFQTAGNNGIMIPTSAEVPGKATSAVTLGGNLPATAIGPLAQVLTTSQPFTAGGTAATSATLLNALDDNTAPYAAGDTIQIQGVTSSGTAVNTTFAVTATTTVGNLLTAINSALTGSTATLDPSGNLVVTANTTGVSKLSLTLSDTAGNHGGTNFNNHNLGATTVGKVGDTATSGVQFYDAQGNQHSLTLVFQKQANNTWTMTGSVPPSDGTMVNAVVTGITFNANGSFSHIAGTSSSASLTVAVNGQATPQTINFDLGAANSFNGLTQIGSDSSAAATQQNGYGTGTLTDESIDQSGVISGIFSNGQVLKIAQLAVANFANPQGLTLEGNDYYSLSSESGPPLIGTGNSGGRGSVQQKQLEDSNVDVSLEFTKLIIAQRGFEVNSRSITVGDQILQDITNIIR